MILNNLCVMVTGAASGLGRATATLLHEHGAAVVFADLNELAVKDIAQKLGRRAIGIGVDIRNPEEINTALNIAKKTFGSLRATVNCAGIPSSARVVSKGEAHNLELWQKVMDVNLTGTFNILRLAAKHMVENKVDAISGERGVIINTASITAYDGQRGQAAYAASKAGVVGLTLPVARDLAEYAIRCVAIAPGIFGTEILEGIPEKGIAALKKGLLCPDRVGKPEEFASFVKHIIENSYANGACYRLDGGTRLV